MVDEEILEKLRKLLRDADDCPRLTQWKQEFATDMRHRIASYGTGLSVSAAHQGMLNRIEMYAF